MLRKATANLRFVKRDPCEPPSSFRSFTSSPARWVHYEYDWVKAHAMVQCTDDALSVRVDLHPTDEPDRRYVVFFTEAGLAVEERSEHGWSRTCDGPCDDDVDAPTRAQWNAGYDRKRLAPAALGLEAALRGKARRRR